MSIRIRGYEVKTTSLSLSSPTTNIFPYENREYYICIISPIAKLDFGKVL